MDYSKKNQNRPSTRKVFARSPRSQQYFSINATAGAPEANLNPNHTNLNPNPAQGSGSEPEPWDDDVAINK